MRARALLLALPALGAAASADDGFSLTLLTDDSARCLDGSFGGYYFRPGRGAGARTFILELEGGGWCTSLSDCAARAGTALGSSAGWPATGCPTMDGGSNGMLSDDCSVNAAFCNATMAHLNYCDGGSFAGYVAQPVPSGGAHSVDLHFRGAAIFNATIQALLARGMAQAEAIILKGCSAGGLATWLHADMFAEWMASASSAAKVVSVADAGFFMDHNATTGAPTMTPQYQWVAETMQTRQVDAGCLAAHPGADWWRCFLAQETLPYVTSPIFATQDLVDSWQMANIYRLPCISNLTACTPAELAQMQAYRADMLQALAPLTSSATNGGYLSSCVQHCHQNIDDVWLKERVGNQSTQEVRSHARADLRARARSSAPAPLVCPRSLPPLPSRQTFLRWYTGEGSALPLVIDGLYGTNKQCYGVPYACEA